MFISILFFTIDIFYKQSLPQNKKKNSLLKLQYIAFQVYFILVILERANKNLNMCNQVFQITE